MPADPSNPFPIQDIQKLFEGLKNAQSGWWDHVDRTMIDWSGQEVAAASTGLFYRAVQSGKKVVNFSTENLSIKLPDDCDDPTMESKKLVKELTKEIDKLKEMVCVQEKKFMHENDKSKLFRLYSSADTICNLIVTKTPDDYRVVSIDISSFDESLVDKVIKISEKYLTSHTKNPPLYTVSEDEDGKLALVNIGKPGLILERGNYSKEVVEGFDYIAEQLDLDKPLGRLIIMHGPPGTGKTHLLRSLFGELNHEKCKFIFLQPEFLYKYSVASLTRLLLESAEDRHALILLIEDADDCLLPRQSDNMIAISTLLNLADGFIGNMLDIRIIATTNAVQVDIDKALKRPGRLCRIIEVGNLHGEQANAILDREIEEVDEKFYYDSKAVVSLAEVYSRVATAQGKLPDTGKMPAASSGVGFGRK